MEFDKLTARQVANAYGVSPRTITNWVDKGFPRNPDKTFRMADCIAWSIAQVERGSIETATDDESSKWLGEYRKYRAQLAKVELEEREGSLIPQDRAQKWVIGLVTEAKQGFLWLPRRMAPILAGLGVREIEVELREEIRRILTKLARPVKGRGKRKSKEEKA